MSTTTESRVTLTVVNVLKQLNLDLKSVEIPELDIKWWISIAKQNPDKGYWILFTLQASSDVMVASKQYQFEVQANVNGNRLLCSKKVIDKKKIVCKALKNKTGFAALLINDRMKLDVTVTIKTKIPSQSTKKAREIFLGNLCSLMGDSTFSDFKFIIKGKEFKVHKNLLAAASPVFMKMFTTDMVEAQTSECKVDNIKPETFEQLLGFIYCGKVPETALDSLFEAANFYDVRGLTEVCKHGLNAQLTKENASDIFKFASTYDEELIELKAAAWGIIKRDILMLPATCNEIIELFKFESKLKSIKQ